MMTDAQSPTKESAPYRDRISEKVARAPEPDMGRTIRRGNSSEGIPSKPPMGDNALARASASPEAWNRERAVTRARREGKMEKQERIPSPAPDRKSVNRSLGEKSRTPETRRTRQGTTSEEA